MLLQNSEIPPPLLPGGGEGAGRAQSWRLRGHDRGANVACPVLSTVRMWLPMCAYIRASLDSSYAPSAPKHRWSNPVRPGPIHPTSVVDVWATLRSGGGAPETHSETAAKGQADRSAIFCDVCGN